MIIQTDENIDERCFYCGKPLRPMFFVWNGFTSTIKMHLACAHGFGFRIGRVAQKKLEQLEKEAS